VFSQHVKDAEYILGSQLKYTMSFLGVGQMPMDILGVPVAQFRADEANTVVTELSFMSSGGVSTKNLSMPDDISAITILC
jgi:hypothetical protein